jgi:hypothetical protein
MGEGVMEFNATFNNISVISWRSVLLVKETGVPGENHFEIVETKSMPPTHIYMTTHFSDLVHVYP